MFTKPSYEELEKKIKVLEKERLEKERLHGIIEMAGMACHELNQPMQVVLGYSELMLMDISEANEIHDNIHTVKTQIDKMAEITKHLTEITRYAS